MTTLELLKNYLRLYFVEHDPEKLYTLLTEDIHCYGFAEGVEVENIEDGKAMISSGKYQQFMDYHLEILREKQIEKESAVLWYALTYQEVTVKYRLIGHSRQTQNGRKLYCLNFCMENLQDVQKKIVNNNKNLQQLLHSLREEEALLHAACASANVWTWVYHIPKDQIHTSKRLQRDFDLPEYMNNYSTTWPKLEFVFPESAKIYQQKVQEIKNGSDYVKFEARVKNKYGIDHWYRIRFKRFSENKDIAICTSQIIDDEKILCARVELEKKKMFSSNHSMLGYVVSDISKNCVLERDGLRPDAHLTEVGLTLEEAMEKATSDIAEVDREKYRSIHERKFLFDTYRQGKTTFEFEGHRIVADGSLLWIRAVLNLVKDPATGNLFLYEYLYDIHEHKMMEEITTAVSKYDYERIGSVNLNANQMTVINLNSKDNSREIDIWDYTKHANWYGDTIVLEEEKEEFFAKINLDNVRKELADKDDFEFIHHVREKNGEIGCRRTRFSYYNRNMGICLMTRADVTKVMQEEEDKAKKLSSALKQAHEALETAENATQAKSEFLSRMSHEIRTPMNAIMGMTAIGKENQSDVQQIGECLDKIDMSSHFLLTLINDILEMSRIESGQMEVKHNEFSFKFLIESIHTVIEPLAFKKGVRYDCVNCDKIDSYYIGDAMRIQQVIVNIISNAIKFTKADGRVRFSVNIEEETINQTYFKFTVADTGIGMSEEFMKRMFQPFTQEDGSNTSEFGGSGLGLAISKSLVEAMKGRIEVESFLGIGTTFSIFIPLERINYTQLKGEEVKPVVNSTDDFEILRNCQVLMAEDHPVNVMVARKILERKGVVVTVAENGKIAVEQFKNSKPGYFDAILMDIRMPIMDGWNATLAIREMNRIDAKAIPIIAMTANALEEDRRYSKEVGMNEHLAKPFEPIQLYRVLAMQIREKTTE